jgi:hypothetical protein
VLVVVAALAGSPDSLTTYPDAIADDFISSRQHQAGREYGIHREVVVR